MAIELPIHFPTFLVPIRPFFHDECILKYLRLSVLSTLSLGQTFNFKYLHATDTPSNQSTHLCSQSCKYKSRNCMLSSLYWISTGCMSKNSQSLDLVTSYYVCLFLWSLTGLCLTSSLPLSHTCSSPKKDNWPQFCIQQYGLKVIVKWILQVIHRLEMNIWAYGVTVLLYNLCVTFGTFLINCQTEVECICCGNNKYIFSTVSQFEVPICLLYYIIHVKPFVVVSIGCMVY